MNIRDELAIVLGASIKGSAWNTVFEKLDKNGKLDQKTIIMILLTIIKYLEEKEDVDIYREGAPTPPFQVTQGKKTPKK